MAAAQKKVIVRRLGGDLAWGYLPASSLSYEGQVELMALDGKLNLLPVNEIELISYVRDFNLEDRSDPERMGRRSFQARPREQGLWVRLSFRDIAPLEGLVSVDLGLLDGLAEDQGLYLTPPDRRGNVLRLFAPRAAIRSLEVLGLITAPAQRLAAKVAERRALAVQAGLFDE